MKAVTVSPKYQIVIPKEIRESMEIRPGEKLQIIQYLNRIEIIPVRDVKKMRGVLRGISTDVKRDRDRV